MTYERTGDETKQGKVIAVDTETQRVTVEGDRGRATLPVVVTEMPDGVVWVPAHCGTGSAPARAGQSVQIDKVHGDKGGVA